MKIDLERLREKKMRPREARRCYETPKWTPRGAPREVKRVQRAPKIIDEGARCLIPCAAHRPPHRRERKHNDGKCKSMAATASIKTFVNKAQGAAKGMSQDDPFQTKFARGYLGEGRGATFSCRSVFRDVVRFFTSKPWIWT